MLGEIKKTDLFCDYYAKWIVVYKQGAIRKEKWLALFHVEKIKRV